MDGSTFLLRNPAGGSTLRGGDVLRAEAAIPVDAEPPEIFLEGRHSPTVALAGRHAPSPALAGRQDSTVELEGNSGLP